MGKRFDEFVADLESLGLSHDEATENAERHLMGRWAMADDRFEQAVVDAFRPIMEPLTRLLNAISGTGRNKPDLK